MAVDAARQLGFAGTAKYTLTLEELRTVVAEGQHPIVFVDLSPIDGAEDIHTLVVVAVSQYEVFVLDPLKAERLLPLQGIQRSLALRHNLAIIVER